MDTESPLVDANETAIQIGMTLEEVSEFLVNDDPCDVDIEDFVDNVRILAALVEMLRYTTIKEDFLARMKTI